MAKVSASDYDLLPHSREDEEALIGSIPIDPDAILRARDVDLQPEDFHNLGLSWIYKAALDISDDFRAVDLLGIAALLEKRQASPDKTQLEAVGGRAELTRIWGETNTAIFAQQNAERVKERSRRRNIISATAKIAALAQKFEGSLEGLYDEISSVFFNAMGRPERKSHLYGGDDALQEYLVLLQKIKELSERNPYAFCKTWWQPLDDIISYLKPSELCVIGAITSVGKTIALENIAEANAMRGHHVVYYHLEQSSRDLQHRMMARHSGVPRVKLELQGYQGPEIARAIDSIRRWYKNMIYVHCPGWTPERVCADIARLQAEHGCTLVMIDYLHKFDIDASRKNEASAIGDIVNTIKNTAERLDVSIVLGAQVNNEAVKSGRPTMHHLRGSGMIKELANKVIMLHRPNDRLPGEHFGKIEPIQAFVDKNTVNFTGSCWLNHIMGQYRLEAVNAAPEPMVVEEIPWGFEEGQ